MANKLDSLYGLRKNFLVIGLTGRLGSGCTTTANLLSQEKFEDCNFPIPSDFVLPTNEQRKYKITYKFLKENWSQFQVIRASDIISAFLLSKSITEIKEFLNKKYPQKEREVDSIIQSIQDSFEEASTDITKILKHTPEKKDQWTIEVPQSVCRFFVIIRKIQDFSVSFKNALQKLNITKEAHPYQCFGDNLRKTGHPLKEDSFDPRNSYIIAEIIRQLIKIIRKEFGNKTRIVIDSIRNSMEARYFKERYSAFYLFAINTEEQHRITRQNSLYNSLVVKALDQEYTKDLKTDERFYKQDIQTCIQVSDVYLHNPTDSINLGDEKHTLKRHLLRYLALILQPGIITPTPEERCMQIAYTAKYNSGCISRQVGAVVTDNSFSMKSIGWNNTAEGQTPCLLRNVDDLVQNNDNEAFSEFEKGDDKYKMLIKNTFANRNGTLAGRNLSFCFKDGKNCIDNNKNQVHTRSLHAEENAMLQIAKYGGEGLKNGFLFTTASPCELCSKKAYQLGIKRIYYIDPYPGIADKQILKSGDLRHRPETELFVGAVGRAYHQLFEPFMAYKDELYTLLDIDYKKSYTKMKSDLDKSLLIEELTLQKQQIEKELKELNN